MPLDQYILKWFFSWYKIVWEKNNRGKKLTKQGKHHLHSWSNLNYTSKPKENIPQYIEIQKEIKKHLMPHNIYPLEAEFLIWYESMHNLKYTY